MTPNRILSPVFFALLATPLAFAQQPTPPTPPAPGGGAPVAPMPPGRPMMERRGDRTIMIRNGPEEGGMQIVPPGMWWKNPDTVAKLSVTAEQQKKMDDIFRQNRLQLVDVKATLEKEQINLEPLLNANPVDSAKALTEISRIADLRAELEKANAKMLLALRSVLSAEQWTRLQAEQHARHEIRIERRGMGEEMRLERATPPDGSHPRGPSGSEIE